MLFASPGAEGLLDELISVPLLIPPALPALFASQPLSFFSFHLPTACALFFLRSFVFFLSFFPHHPIPPSPFSQHKFRSCPTWSPLPPGHICPVPGLCSIIAVTFPCHPLFSHVPYLRELSLNGNGGWEVAERAGLKGFERALCPLSSFVLFFIWQSCWFLCQHIPEYSGPRRELP